MKLSIHEFGGHRLCISKGPAGSSDQAEPARPTAVESTCSDLAGSSAHQPGTDAPDWYVDGTGCDVWDASLVLARYLATHPHLVESASVLELGAGTGVPGLLAARLGAKRVVLTDHDPQALQLLQLNVDRNLGHGSTCSVETLDWTHVAEAADGFDVVLGADIVYVSRLVEALTSTIHRLTGAAGKVLIAHETRRSIRWDKMLEAVVEDATDEPLEAFQARMAQLGFMCEVVDECEGRIKVWLLQRGPTTPAEAEHCC